MSTFLESEKDHARPRNADLVILGPPLGGYMYKVDFVNGPWRGDAAAGCKVDGGAGKICPSKEQPKRKFCALQRGAVLPLADAA